MGLVLSVFGAGYGIAKSGVGVSAVSVLRPDMMVRSTVFLCLLPLHPSKLNTARHDATYPCWYSLHLRPCSERRNIVFSEREICPSHELHVPDWWTCVRSELLGLWTLYWHRR